jgi:hypothetical protein
MPAMRPDFAERLDASEAWRSTPSPTVRQSLPDRLGLTIQIRSAFAPYAASVTGLVLAARSDL